MAICQCGSGQDFVECCGVFLSGRASAPTAEALMRSRYTAFAMRDSNYLLKTWHGSTRPSALDFTTDATQWKKLEILETVSGEEGATRGIVEFKAYFVERARREVLHERSSFLKENGLWYYLDGVMPEKRVLAKPSRNKPCPCGSGKKYKRCCG